MEMDVFLDIKREYWAVTGRYEGNRLIQFRGCKNKKEEGRERSSAL